MRAVIDQNIFHRLIYLLNDCPITFEHVKSLNWINDSDHTIFKKAKKLSFDAILTLDEDFEKIVILFGIPPKIIRLKIGNAKTTEIALLLRQNMGVMINFLKNQEAEVLEIYR